MTAISTLRPGLLVSLKTSMVGNVTYDAREIEPDHIEDDGSRQAKWETTRIVENPREHEEGVRARSKARSLISSVCTPSSFGLLCPESDADKLTEAMREARMVVDAFNASANLTQVAVYIMVGRVASDDVEAIRAINGEVRDLLSAMEVGLKKLDVEAVRAAANKARNLAAMLSPEAASRANAAIELARAAARRIVKAGETAALEIDEATLARIRESRAAFLDLDDAGEIQAPVVAGRAIDIEFSDAPAEMPEDTVVVAPRVALPMFEFGEL